MSRAGNPCPGMLDRHKMLIILSQTPIHINKDVLIYGIQEKGIAKLLYKLNINKASGPDTISCRMLREAADEIAPYLKLFLKNHWN